jgi:hypothetical protein
MCRRQRHTSTALRRCPVLYPSPAAPSPLQVNMALRGLPKFSCLPEQRGQHNTTIHLLPDEGSVLATLKEGFEGGALLGAGCWLAAGGCWLPLAAAGCCWLLLAAAGCRSARTAAALPRSRTPSHPPPTHPPLRPPTSTTHRPPTHPPTRPSAGVQRGALPDFPAIEWYIHTTVDPSLQDANGYHNSALFVQVRGVGGGRWQRGRWQRGSWQRGSWQRGSWQRGSWQGGSWQRGSWWGCSLGAGKHGGEAARPPRRLDR